jgi:uncharacterized protein YndB with AHSA1/START domain
MVAGNSRATVSTDRDLVITRVFDAPRELVFRAWTEPKRVMNWLGPKDFTPLEFEMDDKAGGKWHGRMRSPQGTVSNVSPASARHFPRRGSPPLWDERTVAL